MSEAVESYRAWSGGERLARGAEKQNGLEHWAREKRRAEWLEAMAMQALIVRE